MNEKWQSIRFALRFTMLLLMALAVGLVAGFLTGRSYQQPVEGRIELSVTVDEEAGFREITEEELGGNFPGITYLNLSEVTVDIRGKAVPLEDAIRDGLVTVEQIIAQAKEDVRSRKCVLKYNTDLGLTEFIYCYRDQYDLKVRYDIFECSDGKQYLLNDFFVTAPGRAKNLSVGYVVYENGEYNKLKYEDWGLEFSVVEVTPTGMTLSYNQEGGVMTGDLSLNWFHIYQDNNMVKEKAEQTSEPIPIETNTTGTELTLNWEDLCGELPAGDYTLYLYIYDNFIPSEVHPLIQNYCDNQYFPVDFSVS